MRTIFLILSLVCCVLGCSDEYNPVGPAGGNGSDTTIVIGKPTTLVSDLSVWPIQACKGEPVNYVVQVQGGEPPYTYSVTTSDEQSRTVRSDRFIFEDPIEYRVYSETRSHDGQVSYDTASVYVAECGGPGPEPQDSLYVVKDVNLAVCPSANDDHETVIVGLTHKVICDIWILVCWESPSESDMTFWVGSQPLALSHPMDGSRERWVLFAGVEITDPVQLSLVTDKGPTKWPDEGCSHNKANRVTTVVFTTVGFRQ